VCVVVMEHCTCNAPLGCALCVKKEDDGEDDRLLNIPRASRSSALLVALKRNAKNRVKNTRTLKGSDSIII
jgi:hypothetical protein